MKKILAALALAGLGCSGAQAQQKCTCTPKKMAHHQTRAHYTADAKGRFAENYKVCADNYGYHICGETPNCENSTYCIPGVNKYPVTAAANRTQNTYDYSAQRTYTGNYPADDMTGYVPAGTPEPVAKAAEAPQSQSYPSETEVNRLYGGDTYHRGHIVVGYDPIRAPYEGEPSPQDDGPNKNKQRNLNENSPAQNTGDPNVSLPPASGEPAPGMGK